MYFPLYYLNRNQKKIKADKDRKNEVIIHFAYTQIDSITYQIPEEYQIKSLPESQEFASDFGSYRTIITSQGDSILYIRKQLQYDGIYPAKQYDEFIEFKNKIIKADQATVVLTK